MSPDAYKIGATGFKKKAFCITFQVNGPCELSEYNSMKYLINCCTVTPIDLLRRDHDAKT